MMPKQAGRPDLVVSETPDPTLRDRLLQGLRRFNEQASGVVDSRPLAVLVRGPDASEFVGGLWGRTAYGWLFIELLFLPDSLRGAGWGTELMRVAEVEAVRRGCHSAWLDTFSFQARGFYEKLGYTVFGVLDDYPPGHSRFYLKKALVAAA